MKTWHFHNGQYERVQIRITTMWICYCEGGTINAAYCCINLKRILIYTAFKCETVYFFLILVDRSTVRFKYPHIPLCFIVRDTDLDLLCKWTETSFEKPIARCTLMHRINVWTNSVLKVNSCFFQRHKFFKPHKLIDFFSKGHYYIKSTFGIGSEFSDSDRRLKFYF